MRIPTLGIDSTPRQTKPGLFFVPTFSRIWAMSHKADTPTISDPDEAIKLSPTDRREGLWTKLDLLEMD